MLSLVLPTFNESENLQGLLEEIDTALQDIPFEVIIVDDDSPDRTWELAETLSEDRLYVRTLRRIGRRGLSSAVVEGFSVAKGDVLAVMDSDGQHDPMILPRLYAAIRSGVTVAIGSRYVSGGSVEGWAQARHVASFVATACAWLVCTNRVRDPMSGYFAVSRSVFTDIRDKLRPRGFKILLEILGTIPRSARVQEIPLIFRLRERGASKLNACVQMQFFIHILSLLWRRNRWLVVFVCFSAILVLLLGVRAWNLRFLYLDADLRQQVRLSVESLTKEQGWLMSDILFQEVYKSGFRVLHRRHGRGEDAIQCYELSYPGALQTCT
ncbi:hypothetical protein A3D11_03600 [Candidatus Peribacteria bacterium RIFCSPHIGHO2_02_FULL_49_16]|nr:MAG: hypothetical protein A2880_04560 [Candidatus Peribacteria bacterium RIFCSPHIGHO2_01_FULL_49_38]OGJ58818.1 MAG: hypothetical protein A3D11_03600 [Candidatus Peribacteria bacterium RIFCSPHIGHO2_02_FULL_49_16]